MHGLSPSRPASSMIVAGLGTSDSFALAAGIVAVFALIVATWSVVVARKANKISEGSNDIARDALSQTERQTALSEAAEQERLRLASARAVMKAEISPLIYTVQATDALFRPTVRVRNVGDRDSGRVIVRVYMPAGQDLMTWDDEQTRPDRTRPIHDPDKTFHEPSGREIRTQYIDRALENITPTMPAEFRVILPVPVPQPGQGVYRTPVRVVVRADHADELCVWTNYIQTEYGPPPV
jgi:hypothetical protein